MSAEDPKTLGQIAYEAAQAVRGSDVPWSEAEQDVWEAAARAVKIEVKRRRTYYVSPRTGAPPCD
jgi:hypothetical protein